MSIFDRPHNKASKTKVIGEHTGGVSEIADYLLTKPPTSDINLFSLVAAKLVEDKELVRRASIIFESLSPEYKLLFNCIFWDIERFKKFCITPSSLNGHHAFVHGNLEHTVETCENMIQLMQGGKLASKEIGLAISLLHDAGKAEEYEQTASGRWVMTKRGSLLGHKLTIIEWIVTALSDYKIALKEDHYECLLHGLSAVPNAPDWAGLRQPSTFESILLSHADRLSGTNSLFSQVSLDSGFGAFHNHLKTRPYRLGTVYEK